MLAPENTALNIELPSLVLITTMLLYPLVCMGVVVGTGKSGYEDKLGKQMAGIFLAF